MRASAALFVAAAFLAGGCSRHATVPTTHHVTIFYGRAGTEKLVPMQFNVDEKVAANPSALETYAVNQLLAGPVVGSDTFVQFPAGTHATISQRGKMVTVDLHGPIARSIQTGGTDEAALFKSLTYTLTGLPGVSSVQVLVEGKKLAALPGGQFELDEPLTRDTFSQ